MGSSEIIDAERRRGAKFIKEIIAVHSCREDALLHEMDLHVENDVARNSAFYNQTSAGSAATLKHKKGGRKYPMIPQPRKCPTRFKSYCKRPIRYHESIPEQRQKEIDRQYHNLGVAHEDIPKFLKPYEDVALGSWETATVYDSRVVKIRIF